MIQLPAKFVTAVESVTIDDVSYTDFAFDSNGIVHVFDVSRMSKRSVVEVAYTAGIPDSFMESIKELVSHRVTHALASSNGVTSEAAGGVSVTYNANWINSARATALPDDNKEVLAPYKIQGVF
jgi:NCAIR mutase (PurE)-related protein